MMNFSEEFRAIVGEALTSPKMTAVAAGTSSTLGAMAAMDVIHGTLAMLAIAASVVATLALARFHIASEKNAKLQYQVLKKQLQDMGVEPESD